MTSRTTPFEIIVAEDNPADIALVREALKEHKLDCRLHVIRDGDEAVRFIGSLDANPNSPSVDLLLLDMHLPKRDGEDILKRLRSTERYAQTPVIVMTSSPSTIIEDMAAKHTALVYFQKPSTLAEFMELGGIIREVLGHGSDPGDQNTLPERKNAGGRA